jgi:hypothetical protein
MMVIAVLKLTINSGQSLATNLARGAKLNLEKYCMVARKTEREDRVDEGLQWHDCGDSLLL